MSTITLNAVDLLSKHGFGDGDILENVWDELESEGLSPHADGLLETLVERYLVPLLPPGVIVRRIVSNHNPIRVDGIQRSEVDLTAALTPISATVTLQQIIEAAREVLKP